MLFVIGGSIVGELIPFLPTPLPRAARNPPAAQDRDRGKREENSSRPLTESPV